MISTNIYHDVYLGLGSNMGDRKLNLLRSIDMLTKTRGIEVRELSTICETMPIGIRDQSAFLNAVLKIKTMLDPFDLQEVLLNVENCLGRVRVQRWGPRRIDLDILIFGDKSINTPKLKIPHPEIQNRPFVVDGLRELNVFVDPGFRRGDTDIRRSCKIYG